MKRVLFFVLLFVSVRSFAQPAPAFTVTVIPGTGSTFTLLLDNPERKKIKVEVEGNEEGVVSVNTLTNAKVAVSYDLSHVQDGVYRITVSCGRDQVVKEVEVATVTTFTRNVIAVK